MSMGDNGPGRPFTLRLVRRSAALAITANARLMRQAATLYAALGNGITALPAVPTGLSLKARRREKITTKPAARHHKMIGPDTIRPSA